VTSTWKYEFWRLGGILSLSLFAGFLFGQVLVPLLLGAVSYFGWHFYQLVRVTRQLSTGTRVKPPYPAGLWTQLLMKIRLLQSGARKRKKRLTRFLQRFREAAAALPDAALILSRDNQLQWSNAAAKNMLGISWPRSGGQPLTTLISAPLLEEYLSSGDQRSPLLLPSPANEAMILSVRVTPFGKKHERLVVARDVTQLHHFDQAQRDFIANVSHELRTPLTVVHGFLETMAESTEEHANWERSLDLMRQQTTRMQNLVSDLLTLSKLEMGEKPTSWEVVPVPELLASITSEARSLSHATGHRLALDADADLWLKSNPEELHSVFSNLVINAIRHTPPRTEVRISWKSEDGDGIFCVTDTGPGIAPHHLPRLSERFYRVDKARSRKAGSTGLGLSIVKQILDRRGGQLIISSEPGKGSTFRCRFPEPVFKEGADTGDADSEFDAERVGTA
jgi:two-component system phosphate regulon sensor histidine kinase PhoR